MGKFSIFDEVVRTGSRTADDTVSAQDDVTIQSVDDAGRGIDDSIESVDTFDGLSSSVGTSEDAFRFTEDLGDTSGALDEGVEAGAGTGGSDASISGMLDEMSAGTDDSFSTFDEAGSQTGSLADDIGSTADDFERIFRTQVDDTLDDATATITRSGDDAGSTFDDALTVGSVRSAADGAVDDVTGAVDDTVDDTATATDDTVGGIFDNFTTRVSSWWGGLSARWKYGLPTIFGGLGILGATGNLGISGDGSGNESSPPGGPGQTGYMVREVKQYTNIGTLYRILYGSENQGFNERGYSIVLGKDERGRFAEAGTMLVLSYNARPKALSPVTEQGGNPVPQPLFSTVGEADDAHERFLAWLREQAPEDEDTPDPDPAPGVDGSLEAPSKIKQGVEFQADWSAQVTGDQSFSARLTLAMPVEGQLVPLAEQDFSLQSGESASGTFNVQSGWPAVAPGEYELHAVVAKGGNPQGSLASTTVTVVSADSGDKSQEGSTWGDPQMVRELPKNWYLFVQRKEDGSGEKRFMVVGKREGEVYIYLHSDGRAREEPYYFPTVEKAAQAFKKWLKRDNPPSGTPSANAGRPDPAQVKKDAGKKDDNSVEGLLGKVVSAARQNPMMVAGGIAATGLVGYYLYQEGLLSTDALMEVSR